MAMINFHKAPVPTLTQR